jgi:Fur family ferric uptake transcriptional regulator
VPLTVQRRAVLAVLTARTDHPTADDVFSDVVARLPGVSRGTVYRTLDKLVELGLVLRVSHPGSAARYDANLRRHHHLVCERCGAMTDLEERRLDRLEVPDLAAVGFRVLDYSVHFRGVCRRCASARGARPLRSSTRRSHPPRRTPKELT